MSDKNHEQKNKFTRRKIIIKNLLENRNLRPFCYGNAVLISADTCPLQGRTAPNAKRFGIVSYTYRLPIGMRTIQKDKGSRKKTKDFCGKRSRNGEYRQQQKRLTKSKVCGDEVSYTFWEKAAKKESTEVMNYVVFSMPHGKI